MKTRIFSTLLAVVLFAGVVMAAQRSGHRMNVDNQVARLRSQLNLNDDQTSKVKSLLEKENQDWENWRQNNPQATREAMRSERKKMTADRDDGMKSVLTADQYKKYQEDMQSHMHHGPTDRQQQ